MTLTPAAATFMKRMIRFGQGGPDAGFRLVVKAGGCSGFDSSFSVEAEPQPGDAVIEQEGVRLFLAEASCELLRGYTVDFKESRLDSGFAFNKPGAPHVCGCGVPQGDFLRGAGDPKSKSSVVFMRPSIGCVKKPAV